MKCQTDSTNLVVFPGTSNIFGLGTCVLQCPVCKNLTEFKKDNGRFSVPLSERKLVLRGLKVQEIRKNAPPPKKRWCACPLCDTIFRVEKRPPTANGTYRMEGDEVVEYIVSRDGQETCCCYECGHRFPVFENSFFHKE